MNIYQKKIVKENDIFFLDDFAKQVKNIGKNTKPNNYIEVQPNINIRNFYGINSNLLKKETEKNNRQFRSKSQIFTASPIMDNLIPKEIKTIIIKLDNPKDQKQIKENKNIKDNSNINLNDLCENKIIIDENMNKNVINIKNNNFNTNFISFFMPAPDKKHTRNKSVIINNNNINENNNINISMNTAVYKKSFCVDKPNKIKVFKERSTTAPKAKLNIEGQKNNKINNNLVQNNSSANIHNTIDLCNIPNNKDKNKNQYINANVSQNININNNINNLNVLQYDLSITPDKNNNSKVSEILTSRNNKKNENSKIKIFGNLDGSSSSKVKNILPLNFKNNYPVSKFNDTIDYTNSNILSTKNLDNRRYVNFHNKNKFLQNNARNKILNIEDTDKVKYMIKNKEKLINAVNISENDLNNKIKFIYTNNSGNKYKKKKCGNKNKGKDFRSSTTNDNYKDENNAYDINIKNNINNSNKTNQIKSIPLKLNNSSLFLSVSSK